MSEPSRSARRVRPVLAGIVNWSVHDDRIDARSDAYAIVVPEGTVLIDPLPLAGPALASLGDVIAICLTIQSHQRSAWRYRDRFGAPVYAPRDSVGLARQADVVFDDGDRLPGGLWAMAAPGPAYAGFMLHADTRAAVFTSDVLVRPSGGPLEFVPDGYMDDPAAARASARKLLDLDFTVLCPGHGAPVVGGALAAVETALEEDARRREQAMSAPG